MENTSTPVPGSKDYNVEKPEELNIPQFNSSTEKRKGEELPAVENMNDQAEKVDPEDSNRVNMPHADLGNNPSDDEKDKERIIRR
ncbi:hypothetical protein ACXZ1K_10545 [Pedobacter sp. PWIIR3]